MGFNSRPLKQQDQMMYLIKIQMPTLDIRNPVTCVCVHACVLCVGGG